VALGKGPELGISEFPFLVAQLTLGEIESRKQVRPAFFPSRYLRLIRRLFVECSSSFPLKISFLQPKKETTGIFSEEVVMHCVRCQGTMVTDYFIDMEDSGELWMPGWRCLACGEVVDPVIMKHRLVQEKTPEIIEAVTRKKRKVHSVGAAKH